ncbi:MAG TPA: alpha/beta hydrolase [Verrucomicrobiota bacterium]|jgi:acetyl esterase/lipase|nr:alpha/beta hydrolase [Verrucomicrobiota bacterium]OQB92734.1 MAG: Acetylxylan esterase precursor [Verrucomicrobia bacterium ADurb.Bin118]HPY30979.1 alpha/beta hydrolase [Verrucomicrobiota bacterium]HQB17408.1 alpha/beta hydrolase [Verrucomicrobiota bacterium]
MKILLVALALLAQVAAAQQRQAAIPLWAGGAPGALGNSTNDIPTLTPYLPDPAIATGAAMVICPGGAYVHLAELEGDHYARWLNEQGIAGFVLQYRLASAGYRHPAMLQDATRAVRTVRARAAEWQLDPQRVGIIGSSAGGHLASTLLTHFDAGQPDAADPIERHSSRPDLGILCYPVINLDSEFTHQGSKRNLLGTNPPPALARELSSDLQVTKDTPPCFVWHRGEDQGVLVENSLLFAAALRRHGVPFDLHVYERGPHGLGLGTTEWNPARRHPWTRDCEYWLKQRGFGR